jgi:hypothetical protein
MTRFASRFLRSLTLRVGHGVAARNLTTGNGHRSRCLDQALTARLGESGYKAIAPNGSSEIDQSQALATLQDDEVSIGLII